MWSEGYLGKGEVIEECGSQRLGQRTEATYWALLQPAGSWVRGESFLAQGDAVQFALHRRHQGAAAAKGQKPLEAVVFGTRFILFF